MDRSGAGASDPVIFVRHRRARRYILRVLADGTLRVTLPRWGAKREARAFVEASRGWIAKQREQRRACRATPRTWGDGTQFSARWQRGTGRSSIAGAACCARIVAMAIDVTTIAPAATFRPRQPSKRWMRARARAELPAALLALADTHGIEVPRVSIRNQRSRWGACSPSGPSRSTGASSRRRHSCASTSCCTS